MTPAQLRAARLRLDMTQHDLAEELGYSKRSIERMEAGTQKIERVVMWAIVGLKHEYFP